jgi:hypothetical protein
MIPVIPIIISAINWIIGANDVCPRVLPNDVDSLTRLITQLDGSRSNIGFVFNVFSALVVIGVAAEVWIVWIDFKKDKREHWEDLALWKRGDSGPPHKPITWHALVEMAAAAIVALGVAGEFWFEREIGDINTCIQQADNARATILEGEAGDAKTAAHDARLDADQAKNDAGDAKTTAGEAHGKANAATIAAKDAEKQVGGVVKQADALKVRLEALNVDVEANESRAVLLGRDRKSLQEKVAPFPGQKFMAGVCGVYMTGGRDGREMVDALETLDAILTAAPVGWKDATSDPSDSGCREQPGIYVHISPDAPPAVADAARALIGELGRVLPPQLLPIEQISLGNPTEDADAPWTLVSKDHNLIVILVAVRPQPTSKDSPIQ